ncbi:MAG: hypothetical protein ACUVXA_20365, partial [Candidatus Jordarchaeum sp.]|uniref:hypothetical protein n=1 Tax=Candidatus Jordarchaeum sp. TaxID=2823881 RepID=UPI00404A81C6
MYFENMRGISYIYSFPNYIVFESFMSIFFFRVFTKPWRESPRLLVVGMNRKKAYLKVGYINS